MEFKQVVDNFKARHVQAGKQMGFSLLPLLVQDLINNGLKISHLSGKFYQELAAEIFGSDVKLQSHGIDLLSVSFQAIPVPGNPEMGDKPKSNPKKGVEAIVEGDIIRTDHLVDNIPREEDEGDPLYTAPEDIIHLRPEDCAPKSYDEDFCARIGATKDRR